jgi:hypothetical protein
VEVVGLYQRDLRYEKFGGGWLLGLSLLSLF